MNHRPLPGTPLAIQRDPLNRNQRESAPEVTMGNG